MLEVNDKNESTERVPGAWSNVIVVSLLVALGWLIFELTAQPALGAVAVCAKFGWNDFRTAWWLRRRDLNRRRAAACFWLFVASAFWKMAIGAFVLLFVYGFAGSMLQPQQPANQPGQLMDALVPVFIAMSLTWLLGFGLSGLATARALWLSLRFRIKLWLDPTVQHARRYDIWPPVGSANNGNRAHLLVWTTLFVIYFLLLLVAIVVLVAQVQHWPGWQEAFIVLLMATVILGAILMLVARDLLATRILARYPAECWGYGNHEAEEHSDDH